MNSNETCSYLTYAGLIGVLLTFIPAGVRFLPCLANPDKTYSGVVEDDLAAFAASLRTQDDAHAMSLGETIFARLETKYRNDKAFGTLKSKLAASEFLANQMISQLKKAMSTDIVSVADRLFDSKKKDGREGVFTPAPAKSFYEMSDKLFSRPVMIDGLEAEEKTFLSRYYNVKLRYLSNLIARAGQALAVADPTFVRTHDYVLVLPLLHAPGDSPFDIGILPQWMRKSEQLHTLSDSCLLRFGLPFHAMTIAKEAAQLQSTSFSQIEFYESVAKKSKESHPNVAADCLNRAIQLVPNGDPDKKVALRFEIVQLWLDSSSFNLSAGEARKIFETYPDHAESGKAIWLYYYSLSRANNVDQILAGIDGALANKPCKAYEPKLMYIKWWSLRRKRDQAHRVAALEYEFLKKYGSDPMVAPILLSRSTDLLAQQDYDGAYESLTTLVEKFPMTKAAAQAKKMLAKLTKTKGM
jgi:hypothetical protein